MKKLIFILIAILLIINIYPISKDEINNNSFDGIWRYFDIHTQGEIQKKIFLIIQKFNDKYFVLYFDYNIESNRKGLVCKYNNKDKIIMGKDEDKWDVKIEFEEELNSKTNELKQYLYFSYGPTGMFSPVKFTKISEKDIELYDFNKPIIYYKPKIKNLRIRESPSIKGRYIRTLKKDEKLEFIEKGDEDIIDGIKGNWLKFKTEFEEIGWCFDAYLEEVK